MNIKTLSAAALMAGACYGFSQNTINFMPHYKAGDVDRYHMTMDMNGQMKMNLSMNIVQKVTKVYPNGDADVTVTTEGGKMVLNGQTRPMPTQPTQKMRVNKYGQPVSGATANSMSQMGFDPSSMGSMMPHRPMKAGEVVDINQTTKAGVSVKGKLKILSISGGVAKIQIDDDITTKQTGTMHMVMTALIGTADSKMRRSEGDITGMPGMTGGKMHMTMTRG